MDTLISVEEAQETILDSIEALSPERVPLERAPGRFLAETVTVRENNPAFDNSAMDGYAVRFDDLESGVELKLVGEISAGHLSDTHVLANQAMRIFTGAPMPVGADTVVIQENCTAQDGSVIVESVPNSRGENVRHAGSAMAAGEIAFDVGQRITDGGLGLLASMRRAHLDVFRAPRVAILTTGDELVDIHDPPSPGTIVNSNAYMLAALVRRFHGTPLVWPVIPDDRRVTMRNFERAVGASDLVLSAGGVSVGDHDHVRSVLDEISGGMNFWKVKMKPGKPLAFGRCGAVPLVGLPGNPVSSFVGFHQFVRPALLKMQGARPDSWRPARIRARVVSDFASSERRRHFVTGRLSFDEDGARFSPYRDQSSGNLAAISDVDSLGICDEGVARMSSGDAIEVDLLTF